MLVGVATVQNLLRSDPAPSRTLARLHLLQASVRR